MSFSGTWKSVNICRVSYACIQRIHYKLSATLSEKYCWLNFTCFLGLRNAVDSLALYIARIIVTRAPAQDSDCSSATNLKFGRNTVLLSSSLWLKHRNMSLSKLRVDLRRHLHDFWGQHRSRCTHSIDDLLPHAPLHCAATGEMVKCSYSYNWLYLTPLHD